MTEAQVIRIIAIILIVLVFGYFAFKNLRESIRFIRKENAKGRSIRAELDGLEYADICTSKDSRMNDKEWVELVRLTVHYAHQGLRLGQAYMNALCEVRPDLYDRITGTDCDPLYIDNNIHKFLEFLNQKPEES